MKIGLDLPCFYSDILYLGLTKDLFCLIVTFVLHISSLHMPYSDVRSRTRGNPLEVRYNWLEPGAFAPVLQTGSA